jgi:2-dehydro-3-deoxyphosphooctonate aldolase (KDO 8-P synthase)
MALFPSQQLLLIAGPCSLESTTVSESVAQELDRLRQRFPEIFFVFKGSYDKANRSSLESGRGPGMEEGLAILHSIGKRFGFPLLTDFHTAEEAKPVAEIVDVLQVPAFLCRQTDMLIAAAATGRCVNVKKGQFLSPTEMRYVVDKLEGAGAAEIWQTERGTTFGYQNLVVDMRSFSQMRSYGHPVIFDATHSVQLPGAGGGHTIGQREYVPPLAKAALAAGADGLFMETHPNPAKALSDGPNQIPLSEMGSLLESLLRIWRASRE